MGFWAILGQLWSLLASIPQLLKLISSIQDAIREAAAVRMAAAEAKRQAEMAVVADKLKTAQKDGNDEAQDAALGSIVDDYNRR